MKPAKKISERSTSCEVQSCGRLRDVKLRQAPQQRASSRNSRSITGETSGRRSWNRKIFGSAIQPSVP